MLVDLKNIVSENDTIAVALSGGSDSMALLHYMLEYSKKFPINVIAINVEHGIRGESSLSDTEFVKSFCKKNNVPLLLYKVDCIKKSKQEKLSLEQSARILRYDCFFDALSSKKCDKIATAHHLKDNAESVLFNLFRGTGIKGLKGITENFDDKIIRPFLTVSKEEIENYVKENNIPFVTDQTNFDDDYTRNFIRLQIIPKIKEIFPNFEQSVKRLSDSVKSDDDFLEQQADKFLSLLNNKAEIKIPSHYSIFARAEIKALKHLGVKKDWEKIHIDDAFSLSNKKNGASINLLNNITAIREYDKIAFYLNTQQTETVLPFQEGKFLFSGKTYNIEKVNSYNLKDGLYIDLDKIPKTAIIRNKKDGDIFTKFGGGTKKLNDYLTDKKIPLKTRNDIPLLADGKEILAIFNVEISDRVKIDGNTKKIIKLS